jgi:chromosome segregation ATPase
LRGVEATLASVQTRSARAASDADAAIAEMTALLAKIDEASARNTSALSKRAYALDAAIDGVLERTTAAVDHMRAAVEGQLRGLESGVDTAGRQLTILGDDGARLFNQRLEMLLATSASLKAHFADHAAESTRLQALVAGHVEDAQARLAAFGDDGLAATDRLVERIEAIHSRAGELVDPIASTRAAVSGLEDAAEALGQKVADVDDVLNARLSEIRQAMTALEGETQRVFETVAGLGQSVGEGSGLIGDAADALAARREEIVRLGADLAGHFDAARAALTDLEGGSAAAAAAIEAGLGAEVARLATAGEEAAARIRSALAGVVDESIASLEAAAGERAEAAFGGPVLLVIASFLD